MRRAVLLPLLILLAARAPAAMPWTPCSPHQPSKPTSAPTFGPDKITGTFPPEKADLRLDVANVRNCTVDVALDVTGATASFPFAAQALKGPGVLAAKRHPRMTFPSTSVRGAGEAAEITGNLTVRCVTRVVTPRVQPFRPKGSALDAPTI